MHTLPFSAIAYCRVRLNVWNSVLESGIATVAIEGDVCTLLSTHEKLTLETITLHENLLVALFGFRRLGVGVKLTIFIWSHEINPCI